MLVTLVHLRRVHGLFVGRGLTLAVRNDEVVV